MNDMPERIWLDWPGANHGEPIYTEPPERGTQAGQTEYIRADIVQDLTAERDEALECNEEFFVDNQILKKRVEEARKEWEGWQSAAVKLMKQVTALTAERDRLRDALDCLEIAATGAGVPHPLERKLLHEAIADARAALNGETP